MSRSQPEEPVEGVRHEAGAAEQIAERVVPGADAVRDLRIVTSQLGTAGGLIGAAFMVIDELLSEALLPRWIDAGSPTGRPQLAQQRTTAAG